MIRDVSKVVIEVQDQQGARRFWTEMMGFDLVRDARHGEERWLDVRPRGGDVHIVLDLRSGEPVRQEVPEHLPTSK